MAMTNLPVFTQSPVVGIATLTTPTAITSRANITGVTGLTELTPTSANGKRIDTITIKSKGTSLAGIVFVWIYNGTTSYLFDEFDISAITPSTTADSFTLSKSYTTLILPPTYKLLVSITVQQDVNVFAFGGDF